MPGIFEYKSENMQMSYLSTNVPPPPPPPIPNFQFDTLKKNDINHLVSAESPKLMESSLKLPQQIVPKSSFKLKQFTWSKIPSNCIIGKDNIWTKKQQNESIFDSSFYADLEQLFYIEPTNKNEIHDRRDSTLIRESRTIHSADKINLLDSKKSLNINIFLKQFRCDYDEICNNLITNNRSNIFGIENFEALLKILPDSNEIEILKNFNGDMEKLGQAEKFLLKLIRIPNYKLRIECLHVKEEFYNQIYNFNKSFDSIINACKIIHESQNLTQMMLCICKIGNFLNNGSYCGNAAGFKLASLNKLCDIKSNKNNMSLLNLIIEKLDKQKSKLLQLPDEILPCLKDVLSIQIDNLKNDIFEFCNKVNSLYDQLNDLQIPKMDDLYEFFKMAILTLNDLKTKEIKYDEWNLKLSSYFCEDVVDFRLDECFNILFNFAEKVKFIIQESKSRKSSFKSEFITAGQNESLKNRNYSSSTLDKKNFSNDFSDSSNYIDDLDGLINNCVNMRQNISRTSRRSKNTNRLSQPIESDNLIKFLNEDLSQIDREYTNESHNEYPTIKLRRSLSSNEMEAPKIDHKQRGKSMTLLEENSEETENNSNFENRKLSNRWTGLRKNEELQKLATMYKNFQDDDMIPNRRKSQIISVDSIRNNLEEKLAFFENKISTDNKQPTELIRESKHRHSSFVYTNVKSDPNNIVSNCIQKFEQHKDCLNNSELLFLAKDEGFETQSNSSSSHGNEIDTNQNKILIKQKSPIKDTTQKRRSVCPIITRNKSASRILSDSPSTKNNFDLKTSGINQIVHIDLSPKIKSTNSTSNMYMSETVSTKAKKTNIKQSQKMELTCQSKSKIIKTRMNINDSNTNNSTSLKNISTQSNNTITDDLNTKSRTISSSSSTSTLGSQKLMRKNKIQNVLVQAKSSFKNDFSIKF
ncbi:unnamed protein product [Brachionus calyciflorus]|uniref:FH2 domain-containing protein n=1 Tax=Brachionus calyciflorus TaxID=104777 RepID=A0A813M4M4_9BILA|nr:unnamed protein product [Brachionus calyciflorus]